jgi:hypothetical protein
LQGVAPPYGRLGQSSRGTIGSRRFHPLRKAAYPSDGSMLLTMRMHSACPLPIPKCRSAMVTTLPAPPSALPLVYSEISNCQPMAVTAVVGNLAADALAAAVSARERNDERAISRNRAPATNCNGMHRSAPGCCVGHLLHASRAMVEERFGTGHRRLSTPSNRSRAQEADTEMARSGRPPRHRVRRTCARKPPPAPAAALAA